jgi:hypothetical protein
MLTRRQRKAIKLMFQMTDAEVATSVEVRPETLAAWLREDDFREALAAESRSIKSAAARMTSDAALSAAKKLKETIETGKETKDSKLILDTLKASGAFAVQDDDAGESLEGMVSRLAVEDDKND